MILSVAYNGDLELIDHLSKYDSVKRIYGTSSSNFIGSGRSSNNIYAIDEINIKKAVERARRYNIEFNYLMNSSCMNNKEFDTATLIKVKHMLEWLENIGVTWITLANPYLITIIKSLFPKMKISVSSFSMVESVERAIYYDKMQVDEITVRENIGRDMKLLSAMQKNVNCRIQLIANHTCLYQCPYQFYHDNVMSHNSQGEKNQHLDFCLLKCTYEKFKNIANIIKSRWIRPEDIAIYENHGINHFKITDRTKSTKWILRAVEAYDSMHYYGNLADILNVVSTKDRFIAQTGRIPLEAGKTLNSIQQQSFRYMEYLDVTIDNSQLSEFLVHFIENDCKTMNCDLCMYCKRIANKAVKVNQTMVDRSLVGIERLLNITI